MPHNLDKSREVVSQVRFKEDYSSNIDVFPDHRYLDNVKNALYKEGMEITEKTTKSIGSTVASVRDFLKIPPLSIKSFVYASPEIQAQCFSANKTECVLQMTSGLINLLTPSELKFVIGHELGHFLLNHHLLATPLSFHQSQAQEISADRVGLLCSGSLETSFRALLKIASGLNEKHLTFNISEYISQMKKYLEVANIQNNESTHPSMVLRSRALIWFSMSDFFKNYPEIDANYNLESIDKKIIADFSKEKECISNIEQKEIEDILTVCRLNIWDKMEQFKLTA